jgi:hypothetical protein
LYRTIVFLRANGRLFVADEVASSPSPRQNLVATMLEFLPVIQVILALQLCFPFPIAQGLNLDLASIGKDEFVFQHFRKIN